MGEIATLRKDASDQEIKIGLARIRLKGNPANVSIIFTYALTRDANETIKDVFFGKLQQLTSSIAAGDYLIVAGDFNARGEAQIGHNLSLTDLYYADDLGLLSDLVEAQIILDSVGAWADLITLKVSTEKNKFMAINHDTGPFPLTAKQVQLEKVNHFTY
ncbi:hypothetical protein QYM36_005570 [Artemia franciscana]|uniref:Endonuclease/exonuclease/phosphatase domain-containing protein n=1 Tax=Artemia franciscana TaxID=6661 RepID=A0AA88I4W7_ARTSF|nr:hypothetical protein QYM36_005570 [Artemia franciscana]